MFASGGFIGAFAPHAGLFVELPFTQLGQNAGLLAFLLEAFQGALDGLAFLDLDQNQKITPFSGSKPALALAATSTRAANPPKCGLFFYRILSLLSKEKSPGFSPILRSRRCAPARSTSPMTRWRRAVQVPVPDGTPPSPSLDDSVQRNPPLAKKRGVLRSSPRELRRLG